MIIIIKFLLVNKLGNSKIRFKSNFYKGFEAPLESLLDEKHQLKVIVLIDNLF